MAFHNARVYPCVPSQGSVGASGDLAPLAHLSLPLIGEGEVRMDGTVHSAAEGLKRAGLEPIDLGPKEGLALINGTQVSTALALKGLFNGWAVFSAALVAGAMSVDAAQGSDSPFLPVVQDVRGQPRQSTVAATLRDLMAGSEIRAAHATCDRVQDPYSLRCQTQIMGSYLDLLRFAAAVVGREANAVTDNPLVFADDGEVLSAGNFHAQPIAHASDILALALAKTESMSERRVQLLTNTTMSGLPAFLIPDPGLNSGFMAAQIVAAALAAENKFWRHRRAPAACRRRPIRKTMSAWPRMRPRRLGDMTRNAAAIVAIELLAAAQGIDLRRPLKTSPRLAEAHAAVRKLSPFMDIDRSISGDIDALVDFILAGGFEGLAPVDLSAG